MSAWDPERGREVEPVPQAEEGDADYTAPIHQPTEDEPAPTEPDYSHPMHQPPEEAPISRRRRG